jgi:hypothetical protein
MVQYYNNPPPYCRPVECGEIYPYTTLLPSLSFIYTGSEDLSGNGIHFSPDSIRVGMDKTNANMSAIKNTLQEFADVYGKYRKNVGLIYSYEAFYLPALTANPPTASSRCIEVGDVLYYMTSTDTYPRGCWNYAIATSGFEAEALGVVSFINHSTSCFGIVLNGYLSSGDLPMSIPGVTYFLSDILPGKTMTTNPGTPGNISKPIYTSVSNYEIVVDIKRGAQIANFNVWP